MRRFLVMAALLTGCVCKVPDMLVPTATLGHLGAPVSGWDGADLAVGAAGQLFQLAGNAVLLSTPAADVVLAGDRESTQSLPSTFNPVAMVRDPNGTLLVLEAYSGSILALGDDHVLRPRVDRKLHGPTGMAAAPDGTLYVTSPTDRALVRIGTDGVPSVLATIPNPTAVVREDGGTLLVADGSRIVRVGPQGAVTPVAGGEAGFQDGPAAQARFRQITGLAVDGKGAVYLIDAWNDTGVQVVRRIGPDGSVSSFSPGYWGRLTSIGVRDDGLAIVVNDGKLAAVSPSTLPTSFGGDGNTLALVEPGGRITALRTEDGSGMAVSTQVDGGPSQLVPIAASGRILSAGAFADGVGAAAAFYQPHGLAIDAAGNLWVADFGNGAIRKVAPDGRVTTLDTDVYINGPEDLAFDAKGDLMVTEPARDRIWSITTAGKVTAFSTRVKHPRRLAGPVDGKWYVLTGPGINEWPPESGTVALLDGKGEPLPFTVAFNHPSDLAVDARGRLYVADANEADFYSASLRLQRVEPDGSLTKLVDGAVAATPARPYGLLRCAPTEAGGVKDNRLTFGPDGTLYLGIPGGVVTLTGY
jgi:sugar lactone lactonase YvrE